MSSNFRQPCATSVMGFGLSTDYIPLQSMVTDIVLKNKGPSACICRSNGLVWTCTEGIHQCTYIYLSKAKKSTNKALLWLQPVSHKNYAANLRYHTSCFAVRPHGLWLFFVFRGSLHYMAVSPSYRFSERSSLWPSRFTTHGALSVQESDTFPEE